MWVLSCLASLPPLFVSCLLHHFIYPRFSPLHKFQYLLTFGASDMFVVLVTSSFFSLFYFFAHRYWVLDVWRRQHVFPPVKQQFSRSALSRAWFQVIFPACLTLLLSSRALAPVHFFGTFLLAFSPAYQRFCLLPRLAADEHQTHIIFVTVY